MTSTPLAPAPWIAEQAGDGLGKPSRDAVSRRAMTRAEATTAPSAQASSRIGGGGEEDVRIVGGHRDAVPEPTANVVLHLGLADGLNRLLDMRRVAECDGHPPVICRGG